MMMIKGEVSGPMRIKRGAAKQYLKINAIKEIRAVTGFGLKEAKDVTDTADSGETAVIQGNFTIDQRQKLAAGLAGTGYEVL